MEDLKNCEVVQIESLERKAALLAFNGMKAPEIAQQLGLTRKSAKKLLENARLKISAAKNSAERENA